MKTKFFGLQSTPDGVKVSQGSRIDDIGDIASLDEEFLQSDRFLENCKLTMKTIDVDGFLFSFPDNWDIAKYDDWVFYRNRFSKIRNGIKAVDIIAIDDRRTAWLVEVKDHRWHARTKPSDLADEFAQKVLDTLSAMIPCSLNSHEDDEKRIALAMARARTLRLVLHLEQPAKSSKLFRRAIDPADVTIKLKQLLKPIDLHPVVVEMAQMPILAWTVAAKV